MKNKLLSFCLVFLLLLGLPLTAAAEEFNPRETGSISVSLVSSGDKEPLSGAELSVYYVATVELSPNGKLAYICTGVFAEQEISLNDPELITKLDELVAGQKIDARKIVTDSRGKALCDNLPLGLYFVKQTTEVAGFAPCTSFLVTIPMATEGGYRYDVDASPKTDVAKLVDLTIRKVWNTDRYTEIADSVTVQLLRNDRLIETVVLSDQNDWQVILTDMPESDAYYIQEIHVPKGFTATYNRNGLVFTVTNTPKLAQTGQILWPIPVLALAGMLFLMMGFAILRKPGGNDA